MHAIPRAWLGDHSLDVAPPTGPARSARRFGEAQSHAGERQAVDCFEPIALQMNRSTSSWIRCGTPGSWRVGMRVMVLAGGLLVAMNSATRGTAWAQTAPLPDEHRAAGIPQGLGSEPAVEAADVLKLPDPERPPPEEPDQPIDSTSTTAPEASTSDSTPATRAVPGPAASGTAVPIQPAVSAEVDAARRTDLRVIVLDRQGRPASGVQVGIEQQRHDFTIGFVVGAEALPAARGASGPVWRNFNAVSLERVTRWDHLQPQPDTADWAGVLPLLQWAETFGLAVHWGGLASADPGLQPGWVLALPPRERFDAAVRYLELVLFTFGHRLDSMDLYTDGLRHTWLKPAAVRRLYERADALAPALNLGLRFEQAMAGDGAWQMLQSALDAKQDFIPFDSLSIDHRALGRTPSRDIFRTLRRMSSLGLETRVAAVELGGADSVRAAVTLRKFLERVFADATFTGVFLDGVTPDTATSQTSPLLDDDGAPTPSGTEFDRLFRETWWTRKQVSTDELGNARTRVFAGIHRLTVQVPGMDQPLEAVVRVPLAERERVVVLEPLGLKPEPVARGR